MKVNISINDTNCFRFPETTYDPFHKVSSIPYADLLADSHTIDPEILKSMQEFGFFYVSDIPDYSAVKELQLLKQFFSLPESVKMPLAVKKHDHNNRNIYRGYGPVVKNSGKQHKEMFNIGPHEDPTPTYKQTDTQLDKLKVISKEQNVWPTTADKVFDEEFRRVFTEGLRTRMIIARGKLSTVFILGARLVTYEKVSCPLY